MASKQRHYSRALASDALMRERNRLVEEECRGEFWKPCPGTAAGYCCCGYQILSPVLGCGMYCRYCILQVYFEKQHQVRFVNFDDLGAEVARKVDDANGKVIRLGTGEFADSLYLEPKLGLSVRVARLLEPYRNVIVEFKTKSAHVAPLRAIRDPSKVIVAFSMSTPRMVAAHERATASIEKRLEAARACEEMGFWVAFHFDPMIWYPWWEREYREVADRIFRSIRDPSHIAWWSLGGFRTTPALKAALRQDNRHLPLFGGEMVIGEDGKLRYFRPIRTEFYSAMREQVEKHYPDTPLYLCMESREVWEDSGLMRRIPDGLVAYLDRRAERMLGMR